MKIYNKYCKELKANGGILKNCNGTFYFKPDYIYHREDGPTREWYNGNKEWWYNDKRIMRTKGDVTPEQVLDFKLKIL